MTEDGVTESLVPGAVGTEMPLIELLRDYRPARARKHSAWSWTDEEQSIRTRMCLCCGRPGHYQQVVEAHVREHGMNGLGVFLRSGFVADGHHRIVAARTLGIDRIPIESKADAEARWVRDHGYVDWHHRRFGDD